MNHNEYLEVINGENTYREIAKELKEGKAVGIGWTDEEFTHFDIIFKYILEVKEGAFQRGLRQNYLYIGIIDYTCFGFSTENRKDKEYIQEKLRMFNSCGEKVAELINGIISYLSRSEDE